MPNIDITVDSDLTSLFELPDCSDVQLPDPGPLKVQLPSGGSLQAFADISKGIPTDCALTFSLMMQIAPMLASMECLLKILKLLKPLIDVVGSLGPPPDPIKLPKAIQQFAKAAIDLAPCLLIPTPANIIPFLRDLLCLILKVLKCFLGQMKSILKIMSGLSLQLTVAQQQGNNELAGVILCAQTNAQTQAGQVMNSLGPVGVLLDLAGALFGIAGIAPIKLPAMGSASDLQALNAAVQSVQSVVATIQTVVDTLGGCGS
jgi:hypothetical protein